MKTYTEEDMQAAYKAGRDNEIWAFSDICEKPFSFWLKEYNKLTHKKELYFFAWQIREKCGISQWIKHVRVEDFTLKQNSIHYCTRSQAIKLGLI